MGFEYIIGGALGLIALIFVMLRGKKSEGKSEARAEIAAEVQKTIDQGAVADAAVQFEQVEQVREIHDHLESDPAYAERVRSRFQRD